MSRKAERKLRRRERRARINLEHNETHAVINKPQAGSEGGDPEPERGRESDISAAAFDLSPTRTGHAKKKNTSKDADRSPKIVRPFIAIWREIVILARGRWITAPFRFLDTHSGSITALATIVIAALTFTYVEYSKRQWKVAQDTLTIGQRAYVTIGRKDGVVADFIVPKDRSQNAEIVLYFHNSGHVPAVFSWAPDIGFLGAGSKKKSGIIFTHPSGPMYPLVQHPAQASIIAGDSIFVSTLGQISQDDLRDLPKNDPSLLILGNYEYCDELGDHEDRMFGLRYRNNAPSNDLIFDLSNDTPIPIPPWIKNPCQEQGQQQSNAPETTSQKVRRWMHM
jgi:hypothetical protein